MMFVKRFDILSQSPRLSIICVLWQDFFLNTEENRRFSNELTPVRRHSNSLQMSLGGKGRNVWDCQQVNFYLHKKISHFLCLQMMFGIFHQSYPSQRKLCFVLPFSMLEQGKRRNKYIHVNAVQNFTDLTYKTFTKVSLLFNISLSLLFSHAATIPKT